MSREGGRPVRGYRPSRYGLPQEESEEAEAIRLSNLETYAQRASLGLPIFGDVDRSVASPSKDKPNLAVS